LRRLACVGALVLVALSAACSSSGSSSPPSSTLGSTTAHTPTSVAPTTTSPSTPAASTSTSAAPPLSKFESDPGVQALRAFAAQAARTLSSGHITDPKLDALMTPAFGKLLKSVAGSEVGRIYPGPNPFTPMKVTHITPNRREVDVCWVAAGWSLDPKTHKVAEKYRVAPIAAATTRSGQRWLVSQFQQAGFSCKGVKIVKKRW
jgi:hypothetical protein